MLVSGKATQVCNDPWHAGTSVLSPRRNQEVLVDFSGMRLDSNCRWGWPVKVLPRKAAGLDKA